MPPEKINPEPAKNLENTAPKVLSALGEEPKQYVRTLESDMEALKKGSKPGFSEVDMKPEPEPEPVPAQSKPLPQSPPPDLPKEPETSAKTRIVEETVLPKLREEEEPQKPYVPPLPPTPAPQEKAPLRTYTSDFSERLKKGDASTATVLAAEGDQGTQKQKPEHSRFSIPIIAGGIILIVLGAGGTYVTYQYISQPTAVPVAPVITTPIFVNEREQVSGKGVELANALYTSLVEPPRAGDVRLVYLVGAETGSVFHALEFPAPGQLLRNVNTEGGMAGIVNSGNTSSLFFLLSVDSYGDTFAGMLQWEPKMARDFANLFPSTGTTTLEFSDEVIANHDIRILRDASGQSIILYGYWDPTMLLITRDEAAFRELIDRLATSRTTR